MKKRFLEEYILFVSIAKWSFLAVAVGAIVGLSTILFLKLLEFGIAYAGSFRYYYFTLPLGMFTSALLVYYFSPEAKGFGTEQVIEAVHKRFGQITPIAVPVKLAATIITIVTGGSAGKIGPCGQIGAGLTSTIANLFRFNEEDRKKLVICGISAGFAAVLGTPITAALFGVEVLIIGSIFYEVLFPSLVASIVSHQIASHMGIAYFHASAPAAMPFSWQLMLKTCIAGLCFGLCAYLFIEIVRLFDKLGSRLALWEPFKGLLGAIPLVIISFFFSTLYLGLGLDLINDALRGYALSWYAFLLKIFFTAVTLTFGGSGGIILPILVVGAALGNAYARLTGLDLAVFSAVGMVSLLSGTVNTPISACVLALEFFGPVIAPYATVASIISFIIAGHRSIFRTQQIVMAKSHDFDFQKGRAIEEIGKMKFEYEQHSLIHWFHGKLKK